MNLIEVLTFLRAGKIKHAQRNVGAEVLTLELHRDGSTLLSKGGSEVAHQGFLKEDFEADWHIVEKMDRKKFKYVFGVFLLSSKKLSSDKRPDRETYESESETSLFELSELLSSRYPMDNVKILSAVGVTHEGETIILVQEGEAVNGK